VHISDGEQYGLAVLTGECAKMVTSETVKLHSLIVLKNYVVNQLANSKFAIIMEMAVAETQPAELEKLGEPVKWDTVQAATPQGKPSQAGSPVTGGTSRIAPSNFGAAAAVGPAGGRAPVNYQPLASSPLSEAKATPIDGLNPYSNKWMIKARVMNKSDMRTFSNPKTGDSSVFSFDVCDESAEIRISAWREIAERLHPIIEVGKTYLISKGQLKPANKRYSTLNNAYEITLNFDTTLQLVADADDFKPKVHYSFVPIGDIASRPANATVDVLGVVTDVSAATTINTKTGRELTKRTMKIADDSGSAIELTLWGTQASSFPDDLGNASVVAFKGLRVTDWNQRSLGAQNGTVFEVNPELDATERLKSWWEGGGGGTTVSLSQDTRGSGAGPKIDPDARSTTTELFERGNASGEVAYGTFRGVVSKLLLSSSQGGEEKPAWYSACPKCNKKVVGDETSGHTCESCGWSGAECSYRYIVPLVLLDAEGSIVATAFNDQGTQLLGKKADELKRLKDENRPAYDAVVQRATWRPMLYRLRAKMETYNDQSRFKGAIMSATPINFATEGKLLLADIKKYELPSADLEAAAVASLAPKQEFVKQERKERKAKVTVKPEPMDEVVEPEATGSQPQPDLSQFDD
jgi:replication factor A1